MENGTEKTKGFIESIVEDVFNVVKWSKEAELAFENYYDNPDEEHLWQVMSVVTTTDFYKATEIQQKHIAFAVGLLAKQLDNDVNSPSRKSASAFSGGSLIGVFADKYLSEKPGKRDENLKTRVVNIGNCKNVNEIISYIRRNLVYYIDRPFNAYWLVKNLVEAENDPKGTIKKWLILDFFKKISGTDK